MLPDGYARWLGLPPELRPPTHYQLLGVRPSELDRAAIAAAADRRLDLLRPHLDGPDADECRRLFREVEQARDTLLDPVARHTYDLLTPDAAVPWWKAENTPAPGAPLLPPDGWWAPDGADQPAAPAPSPSAPPPVPTAPTVAVGQEWWKAEVADPVRPEPAAPPPPPLPRPAAPVYQPPPPLPPPAPSVPRRPVPDVEHEPAGPLLPEVSRTYPDAGRGSPIGPLILFAGLVAVGAVVGLLVWKKPWEHGDAPPDGPKIAAATTHTQTTTPAVTTRTELPPPKPVTTPTPADPTDVPDPKPKPKPPDTVPDPVPVVPKPKPKPPEPAEFAEPIAFSGHKGGVYSLAVSQTGKTILSVSDDMTVRHYTPKDPDKNGILRKLMAPGVAVALCNQDRLAVFCDGGEAVVYDLPGDKVAATFENPRGGIQALAPAPDGSFVLTGATDGCVRWWAVGTKAPVHTLDIDPKEKVVAVAVSPDGKAGAFGLSDGRVCTWDLTKRKEVKRWKAHAKSVTALAYAPDGKRLASAGADGLAQVWQPAEGRLVKKLAGHDGEVLGVGWCSDGRRVLTAGLDKQVRLWDEGKDWKADWSQAVPDRAFSLAVDPKDRFVVVGLSSGAVRLLPLPRPTPPPPDTGAGQ